MLLGNGNGTFQSATSIAVGSLPQRLTSADLNRDAKLDIIVPNTFSGTFSVLLGLGNGSFQ